MIRIKIVLLALLTALFLASSSIAFYEYVDEHGVTRYTDDINEVPIDQRYGKEEYTGDQTPLDETAPEAEGEIDSKQPGSTDTKVSNVDYETAFEKLKERQQVLIKERQAIEKEDDELLKDKLKLKPGDDIDAYNEQAAKLKQRTKELEEKQEAFNSKIDALNAEIAEYNENVAKKLEDQLQEYEKIKSSQGNN